ncbi:MAG: hypothetical protein ACOCSN_05655, partial [Halanaeroarchaeum sp.]
SPHRSGCAISEKCSAKAAAERSVGSVGFPFFPKIDPNATSSAMIAHDIQRQLLPAAAVGLSANTRSADTNVSEATILAFTVLVPGFRAY